MRKSKPLTSEAQAFRYALWLLTRRPHSIGELQQKFKIRSLSPEIQQAVLARLEAKKFINDREFAQRFVRSKKASHWGPRKIQASLQKKRISRDDIEKATSLLFSSTDEKTQAKELLLHQKQRFLRKKEKKAGDTQHRAFEFLARKGYSLEAARLAVKDVFSYNSDLPGEGE
ncbi:MAG TPA: regulatory protein RecX [bacterium]|nr:regulatory protein RecX [bacterium]